MAGEHLLFKLINPFRVGSRDSKHTMYWVYVRGLRPQYGGPLLTLRGNTLLLLTVVLLRTLRFLPTIPLLGGGMPPMKWQ